MFNVSFGYKKFTHVGNASWYTSSKENGFLYYRQR